MTLHAETAAASDGARRSRRGDAAGATKLRGEVRLVAPGSLPNDGKIIADERPSG